MNGNPVSRLLCGSLGLTALLMFAAGAAGVDPPAVTSVPLRKTALFGKQVS